MEFLCDQQDQILGNLFGVYSSLFMKMTLSRFFVLDTHYQTMTLNGVMMITPTMNWTMYQKGFSMMIRVMVNLLLETAKKAMVKICQQAIRCQLSTMRLRLTAGMKQPM